ncbi:MAG TPA: DEAD/DEAH box helicase family protein [Candidatus Angelobacter sp.]|nr:DEAD/DEAH box helicase family protein [Candidatus Angelobacter sp.]
MVFQKTWRPYQAQFLEGLDLYLDDKRLHLVAAPGSGKTVLGLEVIRRVDQPTLVLTPTITIRDQWVDRLLDCFLPAGESRPSWVSTDVKRPAPFTVATYQALHALCSGELMKEAEQTIDQEDPAQSHNQEKDSAPGNDLPEIAIPFPDVLVDAGFRTLVVDEAHHLRAEWWKTLTFVTARLENPTIVALTATPPYDVSPFEWQRYEELCGPIDAEVSVPELVLQGDLCPHQDYVYFSTPSGRAQKALSDFRAAVDLFVQRLRENHAFTAVLATHPWLAFPDDYAEEIEGDPLYLSSMVVYLQAVGAKVPSGALHTLGLRPKHIPPLDLSWLEILLSHCLYGDAPSYSEGAAVFKSLRRELLDLGAIERRRVMLHNPSEHARLLTASITKLKSIEDIVRLESGAQGSELRCVILTDFIRKAEMPQNAGAPAVFEEIGVVPIFETLRRAGLSGVRLGVLSGSIVIIPAPAVPLLRQEAPKLGIRSDDLSINPLTHDPDYAVVELHGEHYHGTVRLVTSVLEQGGITALVGTKALLGEGWDEPCINTLILASFVGSYVLSNQMRGRSIRVYAGHPQKTANIWHLVCVEPEVFEPGGDYELLVRRCGGFVGVSATAATIENGTERLGLPHPPFRSSQILEINSHTCTRALDRVGLRERWQDALAAGTSKELAEGLKAPEEVLPREFILKSTIGKLLFQAGSVFFTFFLASMREVAGGSAQDFLQFGAVVAGGAAVISLPWVSLALWRLIRHGTPERSIRQIGSVLLDSLEYEGSISRHFAQARRFTVHANRIKDGTVFCWIGGGTGKEKATFLRALQQVFTPVDHPRYLLARQPFWRVFREDYFAVPDVLARKKEFAEFFAHRWRSLVSPVRLVYTRTPEGRALLLRARIHSLAAAFQKRPERVSCWK